MSHMTARLAEAPSQHISKQGQLTIAKQYGQIRSSNDRQENLTTETNTRHITRSRSSRQKRPSTLLYSDSQDLVSIEESGGTGRCMSG